MVRIQIVTQFTDRGETVRVKVGDETVYDADVEGPLDRDRAQEIARELCSVLLKPKAQP
jgi:hypothetical protein